MYNEAVNLYPQGSEELIAKLRSTESLDKLLEIDKAPTKVILFEQSVLEQDYTTAASLVPDIEMIPERQNSILQSLIYSGDLTTALSLAKNNELKDIKEPILNWFKEYVNGSDLSDEEKAKQISDGENQINKELG